MGERDQEDILIAEELPHVAPVVLAGLRVEEVGPGHVAEPLPQRGEAGHAADVGGGDAAAKAAILAALAFGTWVGSDQVYREGIDRLEIEDIRQARRLGYVVKLLAIADQVDDGISVRVHPSLVPVDHPLASVRGAHNAVFVEGPAIGDLLFMGPGAGGDPTATAVLGDVIDAAREMLAGTEVVPRILFGARRVLDFGDVATKWYHRLHVVDEPGVLAAVAGVFGQNGVSIMSVWQEGTGDGANLVIVTHDAPERQHVAARDALLQLGSVRTVAATIRVVSSEV